MIEAHLYRDGIGWRVETPGAAWRITEHLSYPWCGYHPGELRYTWDGHPEFGAHRTLGACVRAAGVGRAWIYYCGPTGPEVRLLALEVPDGSG